MSADGHWQVRRVPHPGAPDLADLVGEVEHFRREVVFRRPNVSRVPALDRFGGVDVLWHDLLCRGTREPAFRVVRTGSTVPGRDVTRRAGIGNESLTDVVAPNRVVDRYRRGDTVVLQGLHHTNPHLAQLANNVALAVDHPVQVNAYLSPPGAQGLDLHFDFHDVFVVQLGGSKRWRVWAPLERTRDPVKGRHTVASPRWDELADPVLDLTLREGECLYLPRGHPHSAETVDESSDHLTIGLVAVTWNRVLRAAVDAEVAAGRLTASLPVGVLEPGTRVDGSDGRLDGLRDRLAPEVLRHWMAREVWRRQPPTRLRPRVAPSLTARPLAFTPGPLLWVTTEGDRAVLGLGDRVLDMPCEALRFLSQLFSTDAPVPAEALRGLDASSRRVVLTRLLAEGVLTHVA